MINVGCVIYRPGAEPGTLEAKWCHPLFGDRVLGTGVAIGGPSAGYAGDYEIRYFNAEGIQVGEFKLEVRRAGEYYELAWLDQGVVQDRGIGMEIPEGLIAGWRRISDALPQDFETQTE